jgi:hypothetical protein
VHCKVGAHGPKTTTLKEVVSIQVTVDVSCRPIKPFGNGIVHATVRLRNDKRNTVREIAPALIVADNVHCSISRSPIYDDVFQRRIVLLQHRFQGRSDMLYSVQDRGHDSDFWQFSQLS